MLAIFVVVNTPKKTEYIKVEPTFKTYQHGTVDDETGELTWKTKTVFVEPKESQELVPETEVVGNLSGTAYPVRTESSNKLENNG